MCFRKHTSLGLFLALLLVSNFGCAYRLPPAVPLGIVLQPGRYLTAYYRAPDLTSAPAVYSLEPFAVAAARGIQPQTFQDILQQELTRAWQANGLKVSPQATDVLAGTVQLVAIRGESLRFLAGKISADLVVSGAITRKDQVLFAFQDRISLSSPVQPGPPAPKEKELLLRFVAQTFAGHLLNELLLYWPPAEGR